MQCPCGEETRISTHNVLTLKGAQEWWPDVAVEDLPITVEQDKCPSCGRLRRTIWTDGDQAWQEG